MQIRITAGRPGSWVVLDDLAGGTVVFNGSLSLGESVVLHNIQPIDKGLLVCRMVAFQPPHGIRMLHHVDDGDVLFLGDSPRDVDAVRVTV